MEVSVACATADAELRYTLDGSMPTASSALVEGAITISSDTLLSVRGFKDGMTSSRAGYGLYVTPPQRSEELIEVSREVLIADGATPLIAVTATVLSGGAISYSVTETIALGLTPSAITESGVWNDGARIIRWGPFDDGQSRTLTYRVGNIGVNKRTYPLDGTASVNGLSAAISGADQVEPLSGFLRGAPARTDTHSTQVFLFDRDARLAFRTVPNPTPEHVADLLKQLAAA